MDEVTRTRKRVGRGSIGVMLAGGAMIVAALLYMSPAFACTVQASLVAKPGRADPGTLVRVVGSGFQPGGNAVNVYWAGANTKVALASVAPQTGSFVISVTVPANAVPGHDYYITAHQDGGAPRGVGNEPYEGKADFHTSDAPTSPPPAAGSQAPAPAPPPGPQAAPAAQPTPAEPALQAAPAQAIAPAQAQASDELRPPPVDASGFSSSGASAFAPGTGAVAPLVVDQRRAFGQPAGHLASGRSPWILVPLGLVGLVLVSAAGASVVRQTRSQGVRAPA